MRKFFSSRTRIPLLTLLGVGAALVSSSDARAQSVGTTTKPLPDILLLIDNSGSMERMPDSSLPVQDFGSPMVPNHCQPGVESNPNRWGMLLQALTGSFQPFYSCDAMPRTIGSPFENEYKIAGRPPYDIDYFVPYHRPLTGSAAGDNVCAITPWQLPGTGAGVGPGAYNTPGTNTFDLPDTAFATVKYTGTGDTLVARMTANSGIGFPTVVADTCNFEQSPDGQLDIARDYVRFALMTFDSDTNERTGLSGSSHDTSSVNGGIGVQPPFLGGWSYIRNLGNPVGAPAQGPSGAQGHPPACPFVPFEVGARNEHAPPWEGRLVPFPNDDATIYDLQLSNERLQKVLLASRPYGATPIDGMLDDARDYYDNKPNWGTGPSLVISPRNDRYKCRDKYIVLLTDGAPNLDMRPACGASGPGDVCPYPFTAAQIVREMATRPDSAAVVNSIKTFVIGFSVNGSSNTDPNNGFPAALAQKNCKSFYADPTFGNANVNTMLTYCTSNPPPIGSTAEACCKLTEIAYNGSYDTGTSQATTGPFFAESQADIVLAFGQILAGVTKQATTRTIPAYSPTSVFSTTDFGNTQRAGEFVASYIPNALKPWSGEIYRERRKCTGGVPGADVPASPDSATAGDLMSVNLAEQTFTNRRRFISVKGELSGGYIDSARTIRPFATGTKPTGSDGLPQATATGYTGSEVSFSMASIDPQWNLAMDIDDTTCKAGRAVQQGTAGTRGTTPIPALTAADCTRVMWGFTTAAPGPMTFGASPHDFNVRCKAAGSTTGRCSITGVACTVGGAACSSLAGGEAGEVCVPNCSALGAIYHSNPVVAGPPQGFLREEGYRGFQLATRGREPMLFAATTDGILHAFKAMPPPGASANQPPSSEHELWAFIPPAVLPRVKNNYPQGNAILLDGTPVVKDVVWDRLANTIGNPADWHTTLVAGLGQGGRGYYALNVTDGTCTGVGGQCINNYVSPSPGVLAEVSASSSNSSTPQPRGPHFLWQLTDVENSGAGQGKAVRTARDGKVMRAIFGKDTGTPAIGSVQITVGTDQYQVGVAILPGGIENPPIVGPGNVPQTCPRGAVWNTDPLMPAPRTNVRRWSAPDCAAPVPGRGVTIVRLDTGEVIRHFGRVNQDVPDSLKSRTIDTMFDSPIIGTPVVYPDSPGTPIQRIFVGDADGTVWRINVANTNPALWTAEMFQDLYATHAPPASAYEGQPIAIAPTITQDDGGSVVLNVATGDQESFVAPIPPAPGDRNYVYSIRENPTTLRAQVRWYKTLTASERVTGPMVVFDRTLYFASYKPEQPGVGPYSCAAAGQARIWGMHFTDPQGGAVPGNNGGIERITSGCSGPSPCQSSDRTDALIPGVAVRAQPSCTDTFSDPLGGGIGSMTGTSYELVFGIADKSAGGPATSADRQRISLLPPRQMSRIDSWSFITQ